MKEVKTERTVYGTMYEAVDGTKFTSKEQCEKYESVALVIRNKLKELIVNDQYNCWTLLGGEEENKVIAVKMETEEDKDTILQNYYLDQPWILKDDNTTCRERLLICVEQAYREQDVILFGLNRENELYLIDTRNNIIDRLNKLDSQEE